jgi:hypothetical protein
MTPDEYPDVCPYCGQWQHGHRRLDQFAAGLINGVFRVLILVTTGRKSS